MVDDFRGYVRFADLKYDIIALDHTLQDPYSIGFFTTEFFQQLKRIMNPDGIVLLLGDGLSWNTTKRCFRYAYKNINPRTEHALRLNLFYLTDQPISGPAASDYALVPDGLTPGGPIYSDEKVFLLSRSELR